MGKDESHLAVAFFFLLFSCIIGIAPSSAAKGFVAGNGRGVSQGHLFRRVGVGIVQKLHKVEQEAFVPELRLLYGPLHQVVAGEYGGIVCAANGIAFVARGRNNFFVKGGEVIGPIIPLVAVGEAQEGFVVIELLL